MNRRSPLKAVFPREYSSWKEMRKRCLRPSYPYFARYGGRGITFATEWNSFEVFLKEMGPKPGQEYSLDRKDNDGNYSRNNCRWATAKEQANNQSTTRWLTHEGTTLTVSDWADRLGITRTTLHGRLQNNLPPERLFRVGKMKG